jgi:SAM-dependent methyltransferase
MTYPNYRRASWPLSLSKDMSAVALQHVKADVERLAVAAQYGWGHTIDFGPFCKEGLLGRDYLDIAGAIDDWGWWPANLNGMRVADVGCFTGGLSLLMAHRGAAVVYAVDEISQHLAQCAFLADTFGTTAVRPVLKSVYKLGDVIPPASLDLILLAGVLYHLSDMLVGLYALRELLKPGGVLLIQSNAVNDFSHSYANFGRFFAGMWWQPTGLCVQDMCSHMGYARCDVRFYAHNLCIARAVRSEADIPFRRGLNCAFDEIRDQKPRSLDWHIMAPAPHEAPADATPATEECGVKRAQEIT